MQRVESYMHEVGMQGGGICMCDDRGHYVAPLIRLQEGDNFPIYSPAFLCGWPNIYSHRGVILTI